MHLYKAYDLEICSEIPLPELQPMLVANKVDLTIRFGAVPWSLPDSLASWRHFHRAEDSIYCYWNVVGKFQIKSGSEILIDLIADVDESMIRLPLLGPVLALVLHQRSRFILHASAVVVDGVAALFAGASGQGKSTTAATLYGRGHQLMTDDVSAIVLRESAPPLLLPGFPRVKLWPEAVSPAIQKDASELEPIHQAVEKRNCATLERFCQHSVPVGRIYQLSAEDIDSPKIVSLTHKESVAKLLENAYIPMLFSNEFPCMLLQQHRFRNVLQCANLARNVPVCKLERPYSLAQLPELASLIERDLSSTVVVASSKV